MVEQFRVTVVDNIKKLLDVPSLDPDEKRRAQLLNILLGGTFLLAFAGLLAALVVDLFNLYDQAELPLIYLTIVAVLTGVVIIVVLNHYVSSGMARYLFLGLMTLILSFSDAPHEVIAGRSQIAFAFPVILASVILPPYASFIAAGLVTLATIGIAFNQGIIPNVFGLLTLFGLALVAWLSSRGLENALRDLRALNRELDQRVQDRTRELAEALRREHTLAVRNKTILESIADGVLVFDADQQVIMSNPAANRLARRDLNLLNLNQFLTTIENKASEALRNWLTGQKPDKLGNVRFAWHDQTVLANIAPVILPGSDQTRRGDGNVMVLRDITHEAELERLKTLFLGSVSHELRTPMAAIRGYVDLLQMTEAGGMSDTGRKYLEVVEHNIRQLLGLANDLIDMSRIEVGEVVLYREWIELPPVIEVALDTVRPEFAQRGLTLTFAIESDLPLLYLDRQRMVQILLNLLTNAYKYTVKGGVVVEVSLTEKWVLVKVSDTGVGMTEKEQAHLFEYFFRARNQVVQKAGGTGLGLVITKSLVELHGGVIAAQSTAGEGTTFIVSLPLAEKPTQNANQN